MPGHSPAARITTGYPVFLWLSAPCLACDLNLKLKFHSWATKENDEIPLGSKRAVSLQWTQDLDRTETWWVFHREWSSFHSSGHRLEGLSTASVKLRISPADFKITALVMLEECQFSKIILNTLLKGRARETMCWWVAFENLTPFYKITRGNSFCKLSAK